MYFMNFTVDKMVDITRSQYQGICNNVIIVIEKNPAIDRSLERHL